MTEEKIVAAAKSDPDAQLLTEKELRRGRRVHLSKLEDAYWGQRAERADKEKCIGVKRSINFLLSDKE